MRFIRNHWRLSVVLLIYVVIAAAHSVVAPLTIGNDEWAHFLYTRFIAEHGRLPINLAERQNRDEAGTKSDDPPLYHLIAAAAAAGVEPTRLLKPVNGNPRRQLADNFVVSYAFLVHNAYESFPYRGEALLWHVGSRLSILFGAAVVMLTYLTSLELFPNRRGRALVAAALLAFMPAFIFHNSVMTYDGLGAVFTALFLLAGIRAIKNPVQWRLWLALGALGGLAITTKYTSVLLPLEIIFIAWFAFQREKNKTVNLGELPPKSPGLRRVIVAGLAMIVAASWWFGFIVWHFNTIETKGPIVGILEPLMVRVGNDSTAITVTGWLFGEDAVSIDLPAPARARDYPQLAWTLVESFWSMPIAERFLLSPWLTLPFAAAALLSLVGLWRIWQKSNPAARAWLGLLLFHVVLVMPLIMMRVFLSFAPLEAVQGRHLLFPAASAIPILLVWGWERWNRFWGRRISRVFVAGLLLWSVLGQVGWAALVYPSPLPVWMEQGPESDMAQFEAINKTPVAGMRLVGATWGETATAPSLEVTLWWQSQAVMVQDYLVELTLVDEANNTVSYSLSHPAQGRYPTRSWEPDDVVKDVHWLPLVNRPAGAYQLQLRLLDQARQPVSTDKILLGQVALTASPPHSAPCAVWFQGQPNQGGLLTQPYRLRSTFTVVGPESPRLTPLPHQANQADQSPFVSVNNIHIFMVGPDWSETYRLFAGTEACHKISVSVPARNFNVPEIPTPLVANFNNQIQLLGYQLPSRYIEPGGRLPLTLYWQALTYIGQDYQIFDNLLDSEQRRWGGYDRRAKDGYSTLLWTPGEVIADHFGVPVDPDAPHGIYTIDLGLYLQTENGAKSLPLMANNQPTGQTSIRLGPIKVGGPPPGVTAANPAPQVALNQSFGDQITLLGYDLIQPIENRKSKIQNLKLILYWQAQTALPADYTAFVHLRNSANENAAQKDQPPTNGQYPTSLWGSGEIIVDEISLPLEGIAAGKYTPVVGLYNFATGARLPVAGYPDHELRLESVIIP